jgi:hypothetical protein
MAKVMERRGLHTSLLSQQQGKDKPQTPAACSSFAGDYRNVMQPFAELVRITAKGKDMSAAHLALDWDPQKESIFEPQRAPGASRMVRQIAPSRRPARCPECDSIIYSRRHKLCGVCAQPLPEEVLFNVVEARRIEGLLSAERERHRRWMAERAVLGE